MNTRPSPLAAAAALLALLASPSAAAGASHLGGARAARRLQSFRPLTTCACDAADTTQVWIVPDVNQTSSISSAANPKECWTGIIEAGVCDGACLTLQLCSNPAIATFTRTLSPDGLSSCFHTVINGDERFCMQQNGADYIQLWGCNGRCDSPGEDWTVTPSYRLIDNQGKGLCLGECGLFASPSASPAAAPAGAAAAAAPGVNVGAAVGVPLALVAVGAVLWVAGFGPAIQRTLAGALGGGGGGGGGGFGGTGGVSASPGSSPKRASERVALVAKA